jgi:ABC-type branched-subunit amino acid transport system substrate-binding protein
MRSAILIVLLAVNVSGNEPGSANWRLSEQEKHGRQIYMRGSSANGPGILALLGDPPVPVPATLLACANCHGHDGIGRPEGGVSPPNITRAALGRPHGVTYPSGRSHSPYTNEQQLVRAIATGVDPAGNKLSPAMPRFMLSHTQAQHLSAFLRRLGDIQDPGVTSTSIRLGVLLPGEDSAELARIATTVLNGFFADLNSQSRIYNRNIELRFASAGATREETKRNLIRLIKEDEVFALIGCFAEGIEDALAELTLAERIPLIGPLTEIPEDSSDPHRYIFQLRGGLDHETCAMIRFVVLNHENGNTKPSVVLLSAGSQELQKVGVAAKAYCKGRYGLAVEHFHESSGHFAAQSWVRILKQKNVQVVMLLCPPREQAEFLKEAARQEWTPMTLIPGPLLGAEMMEAPEFKGTILTSLRHNPAAQSDLAKHHFRDFAARHGLTDLHRERQLALFSAAAVVTEGLKAAGQQLDREKLIASLEQLRGYDTGLSPLISFGSSRRIGARGAYIAAVGIQTRKIVPISNWIEQ